MLDSYCARTAAGTFPEIQASYFSRYSSHSATPILSPLLVVVDVVVEAGELVVVAGVLVVVVVVVVVDLLAVVEVLPPFEFVSEPAQPANSNAHERQSVRG